MEEVIAASGLLICTIAASVVYYRVIRTAQKQIDASMATVNAVMASFSRQLARVVSRVDSVQPVTPRSMDNGELHELRQLMESSIDGFTSRASELASDVLSLKSRVEQLATPSNSPARLGLTARETVVNSHQMQSVRVAAPAQGTPIENLNPTELFVLNLLDAEGELTGPRIREAIGRTREHTARLLKKLYDAGFIDRSIGQMPYRYKIRKELTDLLRPDQKKRDITP